MILLERLISYSEKISAFTMSETVIVMGLNLSFITLLARSPWANLLSLAESVSSLFEDRYYPPDSCNFLKEIVIYVCVYIHQKLPQEQGLDSHFIHSFKNIY